MRLNELSDRPGATRARKRRGRGIGSGLGKTAGSGTKGQKARAGVAIKGFEGGQMPLHRRLPKRGFNNIFAKHYNEVNLGKVQGAVDAGTLDAKAPITAEALVAAGVLRRARDGVRLLGQGEIKAKLAFEVAGASASAVKAVENAGGSVKIIRVVRAYEDRPKKQRPPKGSKWALGKGGGDEASAKPGKRDAGEDAAEKPQKKAKAPQAEAAAEKPEKKAKTDQGEAKPAKAKPAKKDKSE
jgi:large subunit ribosomal protein L15